ncbi:hypothetical protein PAECIP111894_05650 [Paenibacillus pseudetheri]|uniref:Uncharacterized protein n=1 Tax=Paenibacillus pseudetheri TaxID=2897682 RepID=A0ABN8FPC1_9BACL|nr:hypothetical protein PAECIP111894_05650 [Paenibacillus pseudetheri]
MASRPLTNRQAETLELIKGFVINRAMLLQFLWWQIC